MYPPNPEPDRYASTSINPIGTPGPERAPEPVPCEDDSEAYAQFLRCNSPLRARHPTARFAYPQRRDFSLLAFTVLKESQVAQQAPLDVHVMDVVLIQWTRRVRQRVQNFPRGGPENHPAVRQVASVSCPAGNSPVLFSHASRDPSALPSTAASAPTISRALSRLITMSVHYKALRIRAISGIPSAAGPEPADGGLHGGCTTRAGTLHPGSAGWRQYEGPCRAIRRDLCRRSG